MEPSVNPSPPKKKGLPKKGFKRITRLIMNLVPSNSYQIGLETDLPTLTPSTLAGFLLGPSTPRQSLPWALSRPARLL